MARLAAYHHQEDFHYTPVGHGTKHRKPAYTVYDAPKNNVFHNNYVNGGSRIRALASSEPSLYPTYTYAPKTAVMTLKAKPRPLNNKLIEQSRRAVQRLERMYEPAQCSNPYAVARLEPDTFDCESVYSQGGKSMYGETYVKRKHKSKDPLSKRLSYDSCDNYQKSTELCPVRNLDRYYTSPPMHVQCVDTVSGETFPLGETYISNCEECILPPVSFRSDSSHGRWQQWPWNIVDTRASPAMLSPPSPLDSGLSSQSITSSPSLDTEPVPVHPGQMQIIRPDSHHICSCPRAYSESSRIISSPVKHDSGRSSPGAYTATRKSKRSGRVKTEKNVNNGIVYLENGFEENYGQEQIRYGKLGLIGEPIPQYSTFVKDPNDNCHTSECFQNSINNNNIPPVYYYAKDNSMTIKKCDSCPAKNSKSETNYIRPSVIITEASDKSNPSSLDSTLSPDPEISEKSPEPESSMSTEASNPTSKSNFSDASTSNDLEDENYRKAKRKAMKEIRELEDMYKKCNLSDNDLLERAERRDLPTVHQTKSDQSAPTLTRSNSDTLFEMYSSPYYKNPYESPQRAPPFRRSGIPDIIGDDMALRKCYKPVATPVFNSAENTMTYMLCNSYFTPTVSNGKDILLMDNPDIEYDDLSYRKHYFNKKSKVPDPQPPFGIPLRPPPPQSVYTDYLHIVPMSGPKPLCHPRGNPDVVRDDMAFRTLRKDETEQLYYDSTEVYRKKKMY